MGKLDNGITSSEMASLIALKRLIEIDGSLINKVKIVEAFTNERAIRLAEAIWDPSIEAQLSDEDKAALVYITKIAVIKK